MTRLTEIGLKECTESVSGKYSTPIHYGRAVTCCHTHTVADDIIPHWRPHRRVSCPTQKDLPEKDENLKPLVLSYIQFCI